MISALATALVIAPQSWTLVAGGDVMFYAMNPKVPALKAIAPMFKAADLSYANVEIPLTTSTTATRRKSAEDVKAKRQFVLKADPKHITQLTSLGLDFASLANNHLMDFGVKGMDETTALLTKAGIAWNGGGPNLAAAEQVAVRRLPNGIRVGMVSYLAFVGTGAMYKCTPATAKSPGLAALDLGGAVNDKARARLKRIVDRAKTKCDVLLVALHWGLEKQNKPTAYQISLGRAFLDAGADVLLGAHPHVLQGREIYKGKPILYSMGNLISPLPAASAIYTLRFEGRKFKSWSFRPMRNSGAKAQWYPAKSEPAVRKSIEALDRLIPPPKSVKMVTRS